MRIAIAFDNFGPYHLARLRAAAAVCDLLAIEFNAQSGEYAWNREGREQSFRRVTLNNQGSRSYGEQFQNKLVEALVSHYPDAVAIPGYASRPALATLAWCLRQSVPAILMSESSAGDEPRNWHKEWIKRRIVRSFRAALVGGQRHAAYAAELGIPRENIFPGYDAVDNAYFASKAAELRSNETGKRAPYFLASARFVEKKNLPFLLRAYGQYRSSCQSNIGARPWELVLLGDGPLRGKLEQPIRELKLDQSVKLPGFVQYPDLPRYYASAGAFIHASTVEQWGLVVNEAMASGLPVLVSHHCGCALDLVHPGMNGWTFGPSNTEQLVKLMIHVASLSPEKRMELGASSLETVAKWGPERFAAGLKGAAERAVEGPQRANRSFDALVLSFASRGN